MPEQDRKHLATFRARLLDHPVYAEVASVADLRRGREDIIPEMFGRLLKALPDAEQDYDPLRHFIYCIDRHIELDGDSYGPKRRALLDELARRSEGIGLCAPRATASIPDRALERHIEKASPHVPAEAWRNGIWIGA
jgi:hypothetical protein